MQDFNAEVGEHITPGLKGGFGLGKRNEKGNELRHKQLPKQQPAKKFSGLINLRLWTDIAAY